MSGTRRSRADEASRPPSTAGFVAIVVVLTALLAPGPCLASTEPFLFGMRFAEPGRPFEVLPGCHPTAPSEPSYELALLRLTRKGTVSPSTPLADVLDCFDAESDPASRREIVVVVFVHGWRHGGDWDDGNFRSFREMLGRLALREAEGVRRRVFGVYVAWPGGFFLDLFRPSYRRARRIGDSPEVGIALRSIILSGRSAANRSTVLLIGHSLGGLLLETATSHILASAVGNGQGSRSAFLPESNVSLDGFQRPVLLPDLVLLLAPASEASLTRRLLERIDGTTKRIEDGRTAFEAPLVVYATSSNDLAIGRYFWLARGFQHTAANTPDLVTHSVELDRRNLPADSGFLCSAIPSREDFGQSWHCLRDPQSAWPNSDALIDLPRRDSPRDPCHRRYRIHRTAVPRAPYWIVTVPPEIIDGHNDIFNARSTLLAMSLAQLAGATLSLHESYSDTFEPEEGRCRASTE